MTQYKIEGHGDLARDPETSAIINVNQFEYDQYIAKRKYKMEKNQKAQSVEDEVANIKNEIDEIKSLLKELINGPK